MFGVILFNLISKVLLFNDFSHLTRVKLYVVLRSLRSVFKTRYLTSLLFLVWFGFRYAWLRDHNVPFEAIVIYNIVQIESMLKKAQFRGMQLHDFFKRRLKTSK